jgi:2-keto-3-deoxy-L-rhamnonate aldolase RhmA
MNPVRRALLDRTLTLGTWIQIAHPAVAEILANAGFDWIAADCEHTDIGVAEFASLARGMHGRGPRPLVRVRENDTLAIRQMLDMGAEGVIVPLVNSAAEAERAVRAAKYPPRGVRGFCFSRMNEWGVEFTRYAAEANDDIAVVVMIESREAVEAIDEIVAVEGVDGVFIGPYDMSGSYGMPGRTSDPVIRNACTTVVDACVRAGKSAGLHVVLPEPDAISRALDDGFTFLAVGVDTIFLDRAARSGVASARGPCTSNADI